MMMMMMMMMMMKRSFVEGNRWFREGGHRRIGRGQTRHQQRDAVVPYLGSIERVDAEEVCVVLALFERQKLVFLRHAATQ